jgi:hypothetical protein
MTYGITDFSKGAYGYLADDGNTYKVTVRNVPQVAAGSGGALAAITGSEKGGFKGKPRHMTFVATTEVGTAPHSYYPKRKIEFNTANYATLIAASLSMDGLTFTHRGGHTGEKTRS